MSQWASITTDSWCNFESCGMTRTAGFAGEQAAPARSSGTSFRTCAALQDLAERERSLTVRTVNERLRTLPSVDEVLARPAVRAMVERVGRPAAKAAARAAIAEAREKVQGGAEAGPVDDARVLELAAAEAAPKLRRVINATGVVLHTNLGRAPLHPEAVARVAGIAAGYLKLGIGLPRGRGRPRRGPPQ